MSRTPEPRPALRRADDGSLHPAAPRAEPPTHLHAAPAAPTPDPPTPPPKPGRGKTRYKPGDLRARKATKEASIEQSSGRSTPGELAKLKVSIPKKLRKAARRKAEIDQTSVDIVVADALEAWLRR